MVSVKHPDKAKNEQQEIFLYSLPENKRDFHALMFCYGNAVYKYHALEINPTIIDFEEWLNGLQEPFKSGMKELGYEKCRSILSFTRYIREKRDIGLEEFVKNEMGSDYPKYLLLIK